MNELLRAAKEALELLNEKGAGQIAKRLKRAIEKAEKQTPSDPLAT
jgi:hypothetical protein